jgi:nondiscriminating aspartyl-tRNA synthetase
VVPHSTPPIAIHRATDRDAAETGCLKMGGDNPSSMQDRTFAGDVEAGTSATVAGWVHEIRDLGGIAFLILRDKSGKLQVKLEKDEMDEDLVETGLGVHRESVVKVTGAVEEEPRAPTGFEMVPESIDVMAEADPELPLDPSGKVDAELPTRLNNRTLDVRKPEVKAIFEIRAEILRAVREYFRSVGSTEINTPKIVATGTEGGTELFPITYFGKEAFMNQSPQLFKQLMVGSGLERVFEIGPIFRAEEHNTPRHLNEATMIDFESAFIDHHEAMDVCEGTLKAAYQAVAENCEEQLELLGYEEFEPLEGDLPRLTYEEAIERINATGELDEQLVWGDDLSTEAEKALGEDVGSHYFITDWPSEIKPFYIQDYDDDPQLSKGFDLMHPRMELVSGGQREHRYENLVAGFEAQGLNPEEFDYYTKMFRYGMPPHAGWAYGVERVVMTMLGLENIREAVLFPRDRQRLSP